MSTTVTIPPPVMGWNTRDPLDTMDPRYAVVLDNWFPDTQDVRSRKGYRLHSDGMGSSAVQTIAEFAAMDGTRELLACTGGRIYEATSLLGTPTSLGSGFTSNKWQTILFSNILLFFNGEDQPQQYNGTSLSAAAYTGITDDAVLIHPNSFRNRLYLVEKDSTSVWYGGVNNITGAVTEYDIGSLLKLGGKLLLTGSWSPDSGSGLDEFLIFLSDQGEGLIFQGDYPGSTSDWKIAGRFYIPKPLGIRSYFQLGTEAVVVTDQGIVPVSKALYSKDAAGTFERFSDAIDEAFREAGDQYSDNFGWQATVYSPAKYLIINVPIAEDLTIQQFVMNTLTGAWCRFTGLNASCWGVVDGKLYYGGIDGKVYQANYGMENPNSAARLDMQTAFQYAGDRSAQKRFLLLKPLFSANTRPNLSVSIDVDFKKSLDSSPVVVFAPEPTEWNSATWNVSPWNAEEITVDDWYPVAGMGRAASIKLKAELRYAEVKLKSFHLQYTAGGVL